MKRLLVYLLIVANVSIAQDYNNLNFEKIGIESGLSSEEINFYFQDSRDFLWISTSEGLFRYDGYEFVDFRNITNSDFSNFSFTAAAEDKNMNLWFCSNQGLFRYQPSDNSVRQLKLSDYFKSTNSLGVFNSISIDLDNNIWLVVNNNILRYNQETDSMIVYGIPQIVDPNFNVSVSKVLCTQKGDIWISTWGNGIGYYNKSSDSFDTYPIFENSEKGNNIVNSIYEDKNGHLWAGNWEGGLYAVNISNPQKPYVIKWFCHKQSTNTCIPGNIIFSITNDIYGNIWLGTPYGIGIIENPLSETPVFYNYESGNLPNSISNNEVRYVFRDRAGIMWFATFGGGINKTKISSQKFKTHSIPSIDPLIKSQSVHSFTIDHKGRLLLGVQGLGFGKYDINTGIYTSYTEIDDYKKLKGLDINTVKCFFWDKDSILWIGTRYRGLIKLNPKTGSFLVLNNQTKEKLFLAREINSLHADVYGNIWATSNNNLYRIVPHKNQQSISDFDVISYPNSTSDPESLPIRQASDAITDDEGFLWVSTLNNGLLRTVEPVSNPEHKISFVKQWQGEKSKESLGTDKIMCLYADKENRIWIGTSGNGIRIWDIKNKSLINPLTSNHIKGLIVYAISDDNNNGTWASTNKGLFHITNSDRGFNTEVFTIGDGLQGNSFIKGSVYKTSTNNLLFGGHNGFNFFDPKKIESNRYTPSVHITSIEKNSHLNYYNSYNQENPLVLTHQDKYFSIAFSSLDFWTPHLNLYAYQLKGFDTEWRNVAYNARNVTYSNLKPGKYVFMVKGTNSSALWNNTPTELPIIVKTAPHKTWWAFAAYLLVFAALFEIFLLLYTRNAKMQRSLKLEQIEREKSESINHFKLQFFTNLSHELLTPLSILKILADKWEKIYAENSSETLSILGRNVSHLQRLIKQTLQFRKAETGNTKLCLNEVDISDIANRLALNYALLAKEKNIHFSVNVPHELNGYVDVEKLDIAINNILSNAFKYTSNSGIVVFTLTAEKRNDYLWAIFNISDNGKGIPTNQLDSVFDRFYRVGSNQNDADGFGIGLALTKSLVNLHLGTIKANSIPGSGATFTLEIPIEKDYYDTQPKKLSQAPVIVYEKIIENNEKNTFETRSFNPRLDKTLLIAEDNTDLLFLFQNELKEYINVETATNGNIALQIAQEKNIDIIVSDINMPGLNGKELCKIIKNDVNTSHIPFILITALHDENERIKGYESGADSFLTKPVNSELLIKRIESLLIKRDKLRAKFNTGEFLEPEKVVLQSIDNQLLEKAKSIVIEEIGNHDLNIITLCNKLGISNSMFYRKIKSLLNITPNEFIRSIRLRRAAQLLEDPSLNISDVAYGTGFNDLSYFGVCFKKEFGVTPSAYKNGERDQNKS